MKKGETTLDWRQLEGIRPFIDLRLLPENSADITSQVSEILPAKKELAGAVARLALEYPRSWEPLIDEAAIRELFDDCFEFHFLKQPIYEPRIRLPEDKPVGSLTAAELLNEYWKVSGTPDHEVDTLNKLAGEILEGEE